MEEAVTLGNEPVWVTIGQSVFDATRVTGLQGQLVLADGASRMVTDVHLSGTVMQVPMSSDHLRHVIRQALSVGNGPAAGFDDEGAEVVVDEP